MITIILPIKCSTVKRCNSVVNYIIEIELATLIVLTPVTIIFDFWMFTKTDPNMYILHVCGLESFMLRFMLSIFCFGIILVKIVEAFPKIECIKDEEN